MHYTSWGRREKVDNEVRIPLLIEAGPEELGVFAESTAVVGGEVWQLHHEKSAGARATLSDGRVFEAPADFGRSKRIEASLAGKKFTLVGETRNDWIIDDAEGNKVGQFSAGNNGVRRSILEFEDGVELSDEERAGLSWFVRLVLQARLGSSSRTLIGTLLGFTVVGLIAFVVT